MYCMQYEVELLAKDIPLESYILAYEYDSLLVCLLYGVIRSEIIYG